MDFSIGTNIRELRRSRNLTQEEMAAHLGVSFQAISKWERGEGYPDITQLPALASYFQVSVDTLLGTGQAASRKAYEALNQLWQENNSAGLHRKNVTLIKCALKDYPNDSLLLVQLAASLEKLDGSKEERNTYLRQSAAVQEQILRYGMDSEIRAATQFNICFTYQKLGETQKAVDQARKLPNLYKAKENALVHFLHGSERKQVAQTALIPLQWAIRLHLETLADETKNDIYRAYSSQICQLLSEVENI